MDTTLLILVAAGGLGLVIIVGAVIALVSSSGNRVNVDDRLEQVSANPEWEAEAIEFEAEDGSDVRDRLDDALTARNFSFVGGIKSRLSRADLKLRVSEYMGLLVLAAVGVGAVAYFLMGSALAGLVGALIGLQIPRIYANQKAKQRLKAFDEQLSDTLNLWVNALRSGFSVMQGMEAIAAELPPPVSQEFERIIQEIRLGIDMDEALDNSLGRIPSEDYDLVITAVNIQREVGGNLAEILDIISFTIRERVRIKGEIQTLTAQGRISGWIITGLPFALGLALFFINRDYMMELFVQSEPWIIESVFPCSWLVVAVALIMIAAGGFAIQKIVDIEV